VRLLLDTHVFLGALAEPERLGRQRSLVEDGRNGLVLSVVSVWEMAIKWSRGRLPLPEPPVTFVPSRVRTLAAQTLAVEPEQAVGVADLPWQHRDPFDRLLIAQARVLGVPIVTADRACRPYDVDVLLID